ncbi:MAG: glycosyltransferase [bacterium]
MKIVFITDRLAGGGLPRRMLLISNILRSNGFEVYIAGKNGHLLEQIKAENINYLLFKDYGKNPINNIFIYLVNTYKLLRYVRRNKIKTLSNHSRHTMIMANFVRFFANARLINVDHGIKRFNKLFRIKFLWGNNIISVSNGAKQDLVYKYKLSPDRITVILNSIPPLDGSYKVHNLTNRKNKVVTCIAFFTEQKNHKFLLHNWEKVINHYNNVSLKLVGEGPLKEEMEKIVIDKNLNDKVEFLAGNSNVKEILSKSDFIILTSKREGLPTVILEAFSIGVPALASKIAGNNEIIENGYNGYMYEPNDSDDFVRKVKKMLDDDNNTKMMGKNAQITYQHKFSFSKYKQSIIDYYSKVSK